MIILSKVLKESNQIKILAIRVAAKRTLDNALLLIREIIKTCDKYSGDIDLHFVNTLRHHHQLVHIAFLVYNAVEMSYIFSHEHI